MLFLVSTEKNASLCIFLVCRTNGGDNYKPVPPGIAVGEPCVTDTWYYPITKTNYTGCANPHNDPRGNWCPTEVDSNNMFEAKSGNWGYCTHNCPNG